LRFIRGKYYLYGISSKWDKKRKRTIKSTDTYLGHITEKDGLIPKRQRAPNEKPKEMISVLEYGLLKLS